MPLSIIIAGAGIGGLCTSVALQQAGHSVKVGSPHEKEKGRLLTGINSGFREIPIRRRGWCSASSHSEWRTGTITPRV